MGYRHADQQTSSPNTSGPGGAMAVGRPRRQARSKEPDGRAAMVGRRSANRTSSPATTTTTASATDSTSPTSARRATDQRRLAGSPSVQAMSLRLQAAFGLRRGRSIKIRRVGRPWRPDRRSGHVDQRWAAREIPIHQMRTAPGPRREAKALAGRGSLIPAERSYVEQLRRFRVSVRRGRRAPHPRPSPPSVRADPLPRADRMAGAGGRWADRETSRPRSAKADREAGSRSSEELGHEREQITAVYLGR